MFMSDCTELLIHPNTGLQALRGRRGPGRPPLRSPEDGGGGGGAGGTETGQLGEDGSGGGAETGKETETVEFWKSKARDQEKRAKDNAAAAKELGELKEAQKTQAEKDADKIKAAEAEIATIPAKVAEALKTFLVGRYKIDAESAELCLTATDPELLAKQFDRLLGQPDKRKRGNYVSNEGNNNNANSDGPDRDFVRNLFGNNG